MRGSWQREDQGHCAVIIRMAMLMGIAGKEVVEKFQKFSALSAA